jgi:hypothetical protein
MDVDTRPSMTTTGSNFFLRWEFAHDEKHVVCGIHRTATSDYEVSTVPLWAIGKSAIETFPCASAALRRHAEIATNLRDAGWTVAAYTA